LLALPSDGNNSTKSTQHEESGWASTLGCVLVVLVCIFVAHPVFEAAYSDDYSYIYTAKRAAETGHLIYNGWATASLGILVYIGALFIHVFGFSFTATRAVCWVLSLANVALMHRLFLRVARRNLNAVLAALTISLAPITFSTSLVFFTDLPAMFAFAVTLYCCVRAMQAQANTSRKRWLILAAVLSLVLGSVRQTAWGAALAVVPMVGWRLRGHPGVLRLAAILEVISICVVGAALIWLRHAPYMVHEALFLHASKGKLLLLPFLPVVLVLELLPLLVGLFCLPALRTKRTIFTAAGVAAAFIPWIAYSHNSAPTFLMDYTYLQFPTTHTRLMGGVLIVIAAFLAAFVARAAASTFHEDQHATTDRNICFRDLVLITLPYFLISMLLIETRLGVWPRYVMGLEPMGAVWLLALYAKHSRGDRFKMPAIITAAICCGFAVALAHDSLSIPLQTLKLEQWAQANGLPREQIEAGMEADGWFEVSNGHTIHDPRILFPMGANVQKQLTAEQRACHRFWLSNFLDIHPVYVVSDGPSRCFDPTPLYAETQHFWMRPPATLYLYRYVLSQQMP
jgi:hypothetical protein